MIWCSIKLEGRGIGDHQDPRWAAATWENPERKLFGLTFANEPTHMSYRLDKYFVPAKIIEDMTEKGHDKFYFDAGSNGYPIYCTCDELKRVFELLHLIDDTRETTMQEPTTDGATEGKELTLDEFEEILKQDVEKFVASWREGMSTQPDIFASTMTEGEWGDQWMAHITMGVE